MSAQRIQEILAAAAANKATPEELRDAVNLVNALQHQGESLVAQVTTLQNDVALAESAKEGLTARIATLEKHNVRYRSQRDTLEKVVHSRPTSPYQSNDDIMLEDSDAPLFSSKKD